MFSGSKYVAASPAVCIIELELLATTGHPKERASIIAEMIAVKKSGKATQKIKIQKKNAHVCGLINDDGN